MRENRAMSVKLSKYGNKPWVLGSNSQVLLVREINKLSMPGDPALFYLTPRTKAVSNINYLVITRPNAFAVAYSRRKKKKEKKASKSTYQWFVYFSIFPLFEVYPGETVKSQLVQIQRFAYAKKSGHVCQALQVQKQVQDTRYSLIFRYFRGSISSVCQKALVFILLNLICILCPIYSLIKFLWRQFSLILLTAEQTFALQEMQLLSEGTHTACKWAGVFMWGPPYPMMTPGSLFKELSRTDVVEF